MEDTTLIGGTLGAPDISMPQEEIVLQWSSSNSDRWHLLLINLIEVLNQSLCSESLSFLACDCPQKSLILVPAFTLHYIIDM